jgi:Tol biopolymer transport system component
MQRTGSIIIAAGLALGCADNPVQPAPRSYTVGGTVSSLVGSGLVLVNNGEDQLTVSADGPVTFPTTLAAGAAYSVTVLTQPTNPAQTCIVTSGGGTVTNADVTTVAVACFLSGSASPLLVSNPVPDPSPTSRAATSLLAQGVVYVSLPPGTISNGVNANIRDLRTGSSVTAAVVDGGFDPVPLPALAGDTLAIVVQTIGGAGPSSFLTLVSVTMRPSVVRTSPPSHKRDVPLNAILVIVFSEPIDPATLTSSAVQLLMGTTPVTGTLAFADPAKLIVTFTPDQPLAAGTDYSLRVTQAIKDLSGEVLVAPATVEFGTGSGIAAEPGIYLANADGSGPFWLVRGNEPAWSPDGQRIAFDRFDDIYVINADGSNEVMLTRGTDPVWSPDGGSIVFSDGAGISKIDLTSLASVQLIRPGFLSGVANPLGIGKPSWSPDGESIAFEHYGDEDIPGQIYVMNADGSSPRRLTRTTGIQCAESDPSWSADGALLVFWSYCLGIAVIPGGTVYQNFASVAYGSNPELSPDGSTVVFTYYADISHFGTPDFAALYTKARSGGGVRLLISNGYDGAWSPDGTRIAFVRGIP